MGLLEGELDLITGVERGQGEAHVVGAGHDVVTGVNVGPVGEG